MPSAELNHVFRIAAPPREVFEHLAEPDNYIGLSPLVVAVRDVHRTEETLSYSAVERFRLLRFLRHDNVIRVTLTAVGSGLPRTAEISGEVHSPAHVHMAYRFAIAGDGAGEGDGSIVTDTLRLRTPPLLLRFAASQARAVQVSRARILAERLAPGSPPTAGDDRA
ncbi:SRPBCC family protein [Peterkaempfera sp. SMS 1(5)a]|uniref:SRPBCC family protein n=1 Tax=Peterkaempfera podocarpi TaxID=3232308 RepID=UPI00366A9A96